MEEFYPFFLIVFSGVFFSMVFGRVHFPWVLGLILGGIIVGPQSLGILEITPITDFIGQIGLIFLMFMAGLETKITNLKEFQSGLFWLAYINGAFPFIIGVSVALFFGYEWIPALLVGIIFISSSIAVVIPSLERFNLLHVRIGQSVVAAIVLQDVASLILLSILLQSVNPVANLPLYVFYPLVISVMVSLRLLIPKISDYFTRLVRGTSDLFQQEFRVTFLVLLGTVIVFELLGLHPIIAGFFAGLVLSGTISSDLLRDKIRTISYGIFIPTFFVVIGARTDFSVFAGSSNAIYLTVAIIVASVSSKFVSGWIGGRIAGFNSDQSLLFAVSSIPQLSTTLAVVFTAAALNLVDDKLITAMVALSIVTVIFSPLLMNLLGNRIKRAELIAR